MSTMAQLFGGPGDGSMIELTPEMSARPALSWSEAAADKNAARAPAHLYRWDGTLGVHGERRYVLNGPLGT